MAQYTFTCPLDGCNHTVMTADATNQEDAARELVEKAKQHLKDMHPYVQKTDDEVNQDIRSGMVASE